MNWIKYYPAVLQFAKAFVSHVADIFNMDDRMSVTGKLSFFTGELS
jgi:hypothetical protein